jgi:hypothetical protein
LLTVREADVVRTCSRPVCIAQGAEGYIEDVAERLGGVVEACLQIGQARSGTKKPS